MYDELLSEKDNEVIKLKLEKELMRQERDNLLDRAHEAWLVTFSYWPLYRRS